MEEINDAIKAAVLKPALGATDAEIIEAGQSAAKLETIRLNIVKPTEDAILIADTTVTSADIILLTCHDLISALLCGIFLTFLCDCRRIFWAAASSLSLCGSVSPLILLCRFAVVFFFFFLFFSFFFFFFFLFFF